MEYTILLFFSFFIEAIILWQYTSCLFTSAYSARSRLILLCILYLILFLISLFDRTWINMLSYSFVNGIFLYTQFHLNILATFFHSAMLTAIMGISELTFWGTQAKFTQHFILSSTSFQGIIFFTVFSKIMYFTIILILTQTIRKKNTRQSPVNYTTFLLTAIPTVSIFIMLTFLMMGNGNVFMPLHIMVTISAVLLLMVNLLVFGINQYNQKKAQEYIDMQLLLQKESDSVEYYEMILSQTENQSILIHDIKKHLQSIKLLNDKNEADKINAYIQQLMDSSDLRETAKICDNEMLNAILCRYQRQCNAKHIVFHTDIRSGTVQAVYQHDLTSLFCNLLDNAVESAENIPDSFIELTVQKKENSSFIVIVLINSCRSTPVYDQDGLPVSHKTNKDGHGFGIKSIKKVVNQYHGNLQMYYDSNSGTFHTIITLKNNC